MMNYLTESEMNPEQSYLLKELLGLIEKGLITADQAFKLMTGKTKKILGNWEDEKKIWKDELGIDIDQRMRDKGVDPIEWEIQRLEENQKDFAEWEQLHYA